MKVDNKHYRTVWFKDSTVFLINQNLLPFKFSIYKSKNYFDTCNAIKTMIVRGAGAIGATAGFAMAQAILQAPKNNFIEYVKKAKKDIESTRPTAQDLFFATNSVFNALKHSKEFALKQADNIADKNVEDAKKIGEYGNEIIKDGYNIETHCNAGWLGFVDYGSALSPVYTAHNNGKKILVFVDETRPRSQGAKLTAWELKNENIAYKIIPDNAGAYLMSKGKIDMFIVGADRIAKNGDTANKIGTFEKAVIAKEFNVPFYVAAPCSTFDLKCDSGKDIPVEQRDKDEVLYQTGMTKDGRLEKILVCCPNSEVINPAFDVTPAKYITGIITEKGIIKPNKNAILKIIV